MKVNLKYKIGQRIKSETRVFIVIGFEYVPERSMRYILLHQKDGVPEWLYLFEFEIESLLG